MLKALQYIPGSARLPISLLTAFKEFLPTGTHSYEYEYEYLTPGWRVANLD